MRQQSHRTQTSVRKKPWTSLELVKTATEFLSRKGISDGARLDAEVLLAHVLSCDRVTLYTHFDRPLESGEVDAYRELIRQRAARVPTKYLTGRCEFASLELEVDSSVLIPRPETEFVVTAALELVNGEAEPVLIDVGTGSGNIAVALAMTLPSGRIFATDISPEAAATATKNVRHHGLEQRVTVLCGDLLDPVDADVRADVVVSNPPYISEAEFGTLDPEIRLHEPATALKAGEDGLSFFRRLAAESPSYLKAQGFLVLEIGQGQRPAVEDMLLETAQFRIEKVINDYSDIERVIVAQYDPKKTGAE